jgi:hypothetical protein
MSPRFRRIAFVTLFIFGLSSPLLASAAFQRWCSPAPTEIARVTSPDSRYDAVLVNRKPAIALMKVATEMYVVPRGGKIAPADDPIMIATHAEDVRGSWRDDHLLEIRYSRARVDGFSAVWPTRSASVPSVEIRLVPPAAGSSFAPGDAS